MKVYGDLDVRNGIILQDGVPVLRNEFYLTVKQSDDAASFGGISLIGFDAEFFYVSQNDPNTDEVQISFRPAAASTGEANTASNLGSGEGVFFQKTGVDLEFKSLVAGNGIELSSDNDEITLNAPEKFYATVKQTDGLQSFSGIKVWNYNAEFFYITQNADNADEFILNFRGDVNAEANTASNLGSGEGVFTSKVGVDLRFKSLVAGAGVELSSDADEITIKAPEKFYLTVKQTDDAQVIRNVTVIAFGTDDFYVTSNPTNPDEAVVNLREPPVNVVFSQDFASSLEWIVNHNLNTTDLVWSAYDDAQRALVPAVVDTSNPNTSFFYFAESVAGRAVLVGAGGKVNTLLTDDISVLIENPTIKSYNLNRRASFDYQIQQVTHGLEFGGATGGFYINGVSVAGLDPVFFYSTEATEIATGANLVREGDRLSLSFFESTAAADLSFSMKIVRI
jgi:hypothetical protein